jgi:hypothetical protein
MNTLMFDLHFKGMDFIMDQIGRDVVITLMQQYDDLVWLPLLRLVGCPCPSDTVKSPRSIFFPSFFYLLISFAFTSLICSSLPVK